MAIDVFSEHVLTFPEAARILPRRRAGKKAHVSTLYRWATRGVRGCVLETIQVGGTSCTSREALQRFFDRLQAGVRLERAWALRPTRSVSNKIKDAERRLREEGFN